MITVGEIYEELQSVLGTCSPEVTYSKLNEAIEELANLGNWDPMVMFMDICTNCCEITLPDDVEVPLAINIGGHPADFRNKWFEFHLNGPGTQDCGCSCDFAWSDKGTFPVFRDPIQPSTIAAFATGNEDLGASVRIYGFDHCDKWIMTPDCNNVMQDGFDAPIFFGLGAGMTTGIKVKRITRVSKAITNNYVNLVAIDPGNHHGGTLLGVIRPNITEPAYRRITISGSSCPPTYNWVRMRYRRKTFKVSQLSDAIPLHSVTALKMMAMALRKYENDLLEEYAKYFEAARQALMREQKTRSGPNQIKIQFQGSSYAGSPCDNMV